ncbi:DEAD/DEAH box helicase family protein [Desulfurivibrio alkaliphilus]|nr:DEAD/DEAH box helicase family protein [Desulfurivibrio alkaliphilus]MDF1614044.1 DEAD/DEAH box helicase family protein [Desulfurivibrio alkaliphilus]
MMDGRAKRELSERGICTKFITPAIEGAGWDLLRQVRKEVSFTGKTYTAFQIIWRLWKARRKKRILFLADRNILIDQTKSNVFKPFGQAMAKVFTPTP